MRRAWQKPAAAASLSPLFSLSHSLSPLTALSRPAAPSSPSRHPRALPCLPAAPRASRALHAVRMQAPSRPCTQAATPPCTAAAVSLHEAERPKLPSPSAVHPRARLSRNRVRPARPFVDYVKESSLLQFLLPHSSHHWCREETDTVMAIEDRVTPSSRPFFSPPSLYKRQQSPPHSFLLELASLSLALIASAVAVRCRSSPEFTEPVVRRSVPFITGVHWSHALAVRSRALLSVRPKPIDPSPSHARTRGWWRPKFILCIL
jgi:hypothetical protein